MANLNFHPQLDTIGLTYTGSSAEQAPAKAYWFRCPGLQLFAAVIIPWLLRQSDRSVCPSTSASRHRPTLTDVEFRSRQTWDRRSPFVVCHPGRTRPLPSIFTFYQTRLYRSEEHTSELQSQM